MATGQAGPSIYKFIALVQVLFVCKTKSANSQSVPYNCYLPFSGLYIYQIWVPWISNDNCKQYHTGMRTPISKKGGHCNKEWAGSDVGLPTPTPIPISWLSRPQRIWANWNIHLIELKNAENHRSGANTHWNDEIWYEIRLPLCWLSMNKSKNRDLHLYFFA